MLSDEHACCFPGRRTPFKRGDHRASIALRVVHMLQHSHDGPNGAFSKALADTARPREPPIVVADMAVREEEATSWRNIVSYAVDSR